MKDNFEILFYLSVVLSVIGVFLLTYISPLINPPLKQIEEISHADIEKKVYVEGTIKEFTKFKDKSTALKFYNTTTEIYIPKNIQINFKKGDRIRALGTVQIYQGKVQIIINDANNIEIVNHHN